MRQQHTKHFSITLVIALFLGMPFYSTAAPKRKNVTDLIKINADEQRFDIQKNVATFLGNVYLSQGTMNITAATVTVLQNEQVINAVGNPVKFSYVLDNGKKVNGSAKKVKYESAFNRVTLSDNANLVQADSNIKSETIVYLIDKQEMKATGNKKQRVTTVLMPAQINEFKK